MNDDNKKTSEHHGVLLGADESGGQRVVFERDGKLNEGVLHPLVEGRPISPESELVEVKTDGVHVVIRTGRATSQGPAMVNDDAYRQGWQRIFGSKNNNQPSEMN